MYCTVVREGQRKHVSNTWKISWSNKMRFLRYASGQTYRPTERHTDKPCVIFWTLIIHYTDWSWTASSIRWYHAPPNYTGFVNSQIFSVSARDLLGRASSRWSILFILGGGTLDLNSINQSINRSHSLVTDTSHSR